MRAAWRLEWPPVTTNNLYMNIPHVGRVMVPEARGWKDQAQTLVRNSGQVIPEGRVSLTIYLYPPRRARPDASNHVKLVEDAIFGAFQSTDHRVVELHVYRGANTPDPHVDVVVEPAGWRKLDEVRGTQHAVG